jgi:hypothetical protein
VIERSLGKTMKDSKIGPVNDRLPPEYISFNRNQRFFTIETLAIMGGGYKANGSSLGENPATMSMPD